MYRGRFVPDETSAEWLSSPNSETVSPAAISHGKRIACIRIADFPIAALVRANPELRDHPLVLTRPLKSPRDHQRTAHIGAGGELSAVSAIARNYGIATGMTIAQARALIPNLIVMPPSPAAERSATDALLDAAESISPVIEEGPPGCVWLDLTGVERLFRHQHESFDPEMSLEHSIAQEIAARVHRIGLESAVGIASSKEVADLAARCGGIRVIPCGREREFLDWMPLELTDFGANRELELRLKRLGIRRLGDLARLDTQTIGARMGQAGVALARIAHGDGSSTVIARPRSEVFVETIELEYGIETLEPLSFILRAMLDRICERLQLRGLVAGDMTLSLGLTDQRHDDRRVAVAAPTIEARSLLMLLNLHLESAPPSAAIETIRLTVEPRVARPAQHDMFIPPMPAPDRLATAIARIAALCGPDRVGVLMPADSYRPEAVRVSAFAPSTSAPAPLSNLKASPAMVEAAERFMRGGEGPLKKPNFFLKDTHPHIAPSPALLHPLPSMGEGSEKWEEEPNREMSAIASIVRIALRVIRPAEEIEVICDRERPDFVRGAKICARVISFAGPWRRQGEWWSIADECLDSQRSEWQAGAPANFARDYYELALDDGGVYRVYRDLYSQKWFVDGIYD